MNDRQSVPRSQVQAQVQPARPTPSLTPQTSYTGNVNQYGRQLSYSANQQGYQNSTPTVAPQPIASYQYNQQIQPTPIAAAHPGTYVPANAAINYNRPAPTAVQPVQYQAQQVNGNTLRGAEAYVLSDPANASIPKDIRDQFPTDDNGRLLFFTQPPLDTQHIVSGSSEAEKGQPLQHSEKYMKALAVRKRKITEQHRESIDIDSQGATLSNSKHARTTDTHKSSMSTVSTELPPGKITERATTLLTQKMKQATYKEYQDRYGDEWRRFLIADLDQQTMCYKNEAQNEQQASEQRRKFDQRHPEKLTGQFTTNSQGYITGWQKSFFTGPYLDDYDSRLP